MIPVVTIRREAYDAIPDGSIILYVAPRKGGRGLGLVNPAIGVFALRGFHERDSGVQL